MNFTHYYSPSCLHVYLNTHTSTYIDIDYVAVKAPMFSFARLRGADPTLGENNSNSDNNYDEINSYSRGIGLLLFATHILFTYILGLSAFACLSPFYHINRIIIIVTSY